MSEVFCPHVSSLLNSRPQSIYRGRDEIGGMYLLSQLEHIHYNLVFVMDNIVKGGGRAPAPPSPARADFSIIWKLRQKSAIATLCVLCAPDHPLNHILIESLSNKSLHFFY